ncbi:MAG: 2TM domain-containing protein [Candidatus Hodarchaeota archaeon]
MSLSGKDDGKRQSPFSEDALRAIAKEKIWWNLGLKIHAVGYIFTNIFLVILNLGVNFAYNIVGREYLWFIYVLCAWTIGFSIHSTVYLIYSRGVIGVQKIAFLIHAVVFVLSLPTLFVINYISDFTYWWFLWPDLSWIVALIVHFVLYRIFLKQKDDPTEKKPWIERKIDEELEKVKRRMV